MRILFTTIGYKPADRLGGPVASASALAEALVSLGHEVCVYCTNSNLDEILDVPAGVPIERNGVEVWYFPFRSIRFTPINATGFLYSPEIRNALNQSVRGFDLVHAHLPFTYPTYAAVHAAARHGKPVVYQQHGVFSPDRLRFRRFKKKLYLALVERRNLRKSDVLIALTEAEAEWYRRIGCRNRIEVIPNGVHLPALDGIGAWSHPGIPENAPLVLFLSRIHPLKGPRRLIEAFRLVLEEIPDVHLVIAGPDEVGMVKNLKRYAVDLAGHVHFPGMISGDQKSELYFRASVFCLPSDAEGFSMSVLEALAHATPAVISPECHFPEVESAGAGLVARNKPEEIARAIIRILSNPAQAGYCPAARKLVELDYAWEGIATRMETVYKSLTRA